MKKKDRDALRKLAKKATPGPWHWHCRGCGIIEAMEIPDPKGGGPFGVHVAEVYAHHGHGKNAPYITALSPPVVLGLLDYVDALEAKLRKAKR